MQCLWQQDAYVINLVVSTLKNASNKNKSCLVLGLYKRIAQLIDLLRNACTYNVTNYSWMLIIK